MQLSVLSLASLALHIYEPSKPLDKWNRHSVEKNEEIGFSAATYEQESIMVCVFEGSLAFEKWFDDLKGMINDWIDFDWAIADFDLPIARRKLHKDQYEASRKYFSSFCLKALKEKKRAFVTGHSLGGSLTQLTAGFDVGVSKMLPDPGVIGVAFNPLGCKKLQGGPHPPDNEPNLINFIMEKEIGTWAAGQHIGTQVFIQGPKKLLRQDKSCKNAALIAPRMILNPNIIDKKKLDALDKNGIANGMEIDKFRCQHVLPRMNDMISLHSMELMFNTLKNLLWASKQVDEIINLNDATLLEKYFEGSLDTE
jgi:hypothetical protein